MSENKDNNQNNESRTNPYEFDCPQFTNFNSIINKENNDISEEYCQNYFNKKHDEMKRNSSEFKKETTNNNNNNNNMDIDAEEESDSDSDCINNINQIIPNLLSAEDFHNSSSMSNSNSSHNSSQNETKLLRTQQLTSKYRNTNPLTTEELRLKEAEEKKVELSKLQTENAKRVAKMRDDQYVFQPKRSNKLTIPITPALHTQQRAKQRLKHRPNKINESDENNINNKKRKYEKLKKTIPQSFKLSKTKRKRNESVNLSTEDKQVRDIKKRGNFHARKINPKIFKSNASNLGILNNITNKKINTTTVQPFNLMTEKRAQKHKESTTKS